MEHKKEPVAVLLVILIAVAALGFFVIFVINKLQSLQAQITASNSANGVDVSGWQTYQNDQYGFEIEYPPQWEISTNGLTSDTPFITLGNPLDGTKTYTLQIFVENNPDSLTSGDYAHALINAARAQDASNTATGPAPQQAPKFDKSYVLTAGNYAGYELYNVFEFDHGAERVYVANGDEVLRFDFPVAQENPNLSLPVANNGIVHQILNTLVFTN